jgi:hypothetical protein
MVRPTSMLPVRNSPLHSQPAPAPSRSTALDRIEPERGQVWATMFSIPGGGRPETFFATAAWRDDLAALLSGWMQVPKGCNQR